MSVTSRKGRRITRSIMRFRAGAPDRPQSEWTDAQRAAWREEVAELAELRSKRQ